MNSYENRVYQLGMDDGPPVVAKFYRPARWSDDAILEEHAFTLRLAEAEIPVVPPMVLEGGKTLHRFADLTDFDLLVTDDGASVSQLRDLSDHSVIYKLAPVGSRPSLPDR